MFRFGRERCVLVFVSQHYFLSSTVLVASHFFLAQEPGRKTRKRPRNETDARGSSYLIVHVGGSRPVVLLVKKSNRKSVRFFFNLKSTQNLPLLPVCMFGMFAPWPH
jgi:hypothetical protein